MENLDQDYIQYIDWKAIKKVLDLEFIPGRDKVYDGGGAADYCNGILDGENALV